MTWGARVVLILIAVLGGSAAAARSINTVPFTAKKVFRLRRYPDGMEMRTTESIVAFRADGSNVRASASRVKEVRTTIDAPAGRIVSIEGTTESKSTTALGKSEAATGGRAADAARL